MQEGLKSVLIKNKVIKIALPFEILTILKKKFNVDPENGVLSPS